MQFAVLDSPLDAPPPAAYSTGCEGGDGFILEHEGHLYVLYVRAKLPPSTSFFVNSRTLMGCTDPRSTSILSSQ